MGLVFSILITDYTITGNKKHLDDAYFVLIIIGIYFFLFMWLRHLYRFYYNEDKYSFRYRSIFKKREVLFEDIAEVKYYKGGRGSSSFRLKDVYGEKYTIPLGFFSVQNLVNYIFLNSQVNIYGHENKWIILNKNRRSLQ